METKKIFRIPEIKLTYQPSAELFTRPQIKDADQAYELFMKIWEPDTFYLLEHFYALFLNRGLKIIGVFNLGKGGTSGVVVDLKLLMTAALKSNASSLIVAHNHPSGGIIPSPADVQITTKINNACNLLDMSLSDHLILGHQSYYSFRNEGLL